jgi:hypothetical protein
VSVYVTDTHPLVWYATNKHGKLSKKVLSAFNAASREEALIYVPSFVFGKSPCFSKCDARGMPPRGAFRAVLFHLSKDYCPNIQKHQP